MKPGKHSATAEFAASRRALHQMLDRPLVLDDPIAIRLLEPDAREKLTTLASAPRPIGQGRVRAWIAARGRYCEDSLAAAVRERAVSQYVILGAGLDTFAYRSPLAASLRTFEVDVPATQTLKRERLRQAGIGEPPFVTFVTLDLERPSLLESLTAAGAKTNAATYFGALGLVQYLSRDKLLEMFRMIATTFPRGSEMAFDYATPPELLPPPARQAQETMQEVLAGMGEPVRSFIVPSKLKLALADIGFRDVEQLDADAVNGRYFFARQDGLRVGPVFALARAAV